MVLEMANKCGHNSQRISDMESESDSEAENEEEEQDVLQLVDQQLVRMEEEDARGPEVDSTREDDQASCSPPFLEPIRAPLSETWRDEDSSPPRLDCYALSPQESIGA